MRSPQGQGVGGARGREAQNEAIWKPRWETIENGKGYQRGYLFDDSIMNVDLKFLDVRQKGNRMSFHLRVEGSGPASALPPCAEHMKESPEQPRAQKRCPGFIDEG